MLTSGSDVTGLQYVRLYEYNVQL